MSTIGHNAPSSISTKDDALGVAAVIAGLRAAIETAEAEFKPHLDELAAEAKEYRAERDALTKPYAERMEALRKMLADWLAGDPDGQLKDGDRIVATLSRKGAAPKVNADRLPDAYKTLQPNMNAINAALARGEHIEGVTIPVTTVLRVL